MNLFKNILFQSIPDINDLCKYDISENQKLKLWRIELDPKNEHGQEAMCLSVYDNHISMGYDYYEKRYDFSEESLEETINIVVATVSSILRETLISLTTYSYHINATRVSDLYNPQEAKKVRRKKNFRCRSWLGTYDDDFP